MIEVLNVGLYYPEKYLKAAIANVEQVLGKQDSKLPSHCPTPFTSGYHPAEDTTTELNDRGIKTYQEMIGVLRWAVGFGRLDILLEVSLLSSYLAIPRTGHLSQVYHLFGYLKHSPRRRLFMNLDEPKISIGPIFIVMRRRLYLETCLNH